MTEQAACGVTGIWNPSENLPPRVKKLRDEYFSFYDRDYFRNEVRAYSTGTEWDSVYSIYVWTILPELFPFFTAFSDSLLASAEIVEQPKDYWSKPLAVRRAEFFGQVISERLPVKILDGELIVGSYFNTALSKNHTKREGRILKRCVTRWLDEARMIHETGIGNCGAVPGHLIPNYKKVVQRGLTGIVDEIEEELAVRPPKSKRDNLHAMRICLEAVPGLTERYAVEAERLASATDDANRRAELLDIARICRKVPWDAPETFHEALQALWFTHMLVMAAESYPGPGLSHGRIDQYLEHLYAKDIREGRITRDQAKELLMCYWIRHNYAYDFQGRIGSNQGINSGFGQLVTLSGCGPDGEDLTNDLTWLILEVIEEMNLLEPKPNIRIHKNTPPELLERICEMLARAQGAPFLLNFDEASIRGLKWQGLPEDQLWDYAPVGCLENTLQGNDRSGTVDVNLNVAKAVELVFNNGRDELTGRRLGPRTGEPESFKTFEAFYSALNKQLDAIVDRIIEAAGEADGMRAAFEPTPYLSTLVDGCIKNGVDITSGGAEYNFITVEGIGFATLVDSVVAVKSLVFDQKKISMHELALALKDNFEGHEKTRMLLMNRAPKYGTDSDEADKLARELSEHWTKRTFGRVSKKTGRRFRGGYLSWNYWISYGPLTAATPDGRLRGQFLSNGIGPVNGMDKKGPTANIRSVGKVGLETAPNGASHTMSISPSLLRDPEHKEKLAALIRAYGEQGGTALQINMLDVDTLKKARDNPQEYSNLLVRVTGYNAYFVNLGREIQEEIIARESGVL